MAQLSTHYIVHLPRARLELYPKYIRVAAIVHLARCKSHYPVSDEAHLDRKPGLIGIHPYWTNNFREGLHFPKAPKVKRKTKQHLFSQIVYRANITNALKIRHYSAAILLCCLLALAFALSKVTLNLLTCTNIRPLHQVARLYRPVHKLSMKNMMPAHKQHRPRWPLASNSLLVFRTKLFFSFVSEFSSFNSV